MPPETPLDDPVIENSLRKGGLGKAVASVESEPLYRVVGESKLPVSKHLGKLWEGRKGQGMAARGSSETAWDEAIRYYSNDQIGNRTQAEAASGNKPPNRLGDNWTETENIVFSNCAIMVPMLYAKNPEIEITATNEAQRYFATCVELLGKIIMRKKTAPGLNLKSKMRRTVLTALLTNHAIIKIGWTFKDDASETAVAQLQELATQLEKAKSKKEIHAIEGKIMALEERVAMLQPSGPFVRNLLPHRIVRDPTSVEPDFSDANWVMEWDYLPTDYINAVYGKEDGEQVRSIYNPTHVLKGNGGTAVEEQVNNFQLLNSDDTIEASAYGFNNIQAFKAACYTKVWYVWDKTTRRVLMFADNNWTWPIWVWDDPLKLPRFFPYFVLWFHESTNSNAPKGEVTYYLDQQDAINEIHSEVRTGRQWARRNIFFNQNLISQQDVESVLKGPDGTARGLNVPEGMKLEDCVFSIVPPGLRMPEFFSTDSQFAAVNRITGVNDAMRGAQFKTNTTNKAVEAYNKNTDIRVDERTDLIEDFIGDIMHNVLMLCMMNWTKQDVADLIPTHVDSWVQVTDSRDFETRINLQVEGGSVAKPTSQTKKEQALQLAQVLGQFANAAPATIIVMLRMIEAAFDEVDISQEDWQMIEQTMTQALMKAGAGPGQGEPQGGGGGDDPQARTREELEARTRERIDKLPPEAKRKLEEMVQGGMPPAKALDSIEAELNKTP